MWLVGGLDGRKVLHATTLLFSNAEFTLNIELKKSVL